MNNLLNIILKNTYTLSQLKHRLKALKIYLSQNFFGGEQAELLTPETSVWLKSLPEDFLYSFTKDNIAQIFQDMEKQINQMAVLTVYLAFDADDPAIEQIAQKAREIFAKTLLLDIKYNPALLAGCALSWKGMYRDYSLHSRIKERQLPILQSFKKFLR